MASSELLWTEPRNEIQMMFFFSTFIQMEYRIQYIHGKYSVISQSVWSKALHFEKYRRFIHNVLGRKPSEDLIQQNFHRGNILFKKFICEPVKKWLFWITLDSSTSQSIIIILNSVDLLISTSIYRYDVVLFKISRSSDIEPPITLKALLCTYSACTLSRFFSPLPPPLPIRLFDYSPHPH